MTAEMLNKGAIWRLFFNQERWIDMDYLQEIKNRASKLEQQKATDWDVNEINALASDEALNVYVSKDLHNGPGDAYRHILVSAEITRRSGTVDGFMAGYGHEFNNYLGGSPSREIDMDIHNNAIGRDIGTRAESWHDVVRMARQKMEDSAKNGDGGGENDTAMWINKTPVEQWPVGWKDKPPLTYPKAGQEHQKTYFKFNPDDYRTWSQSEVNAVHRKVLDLPSGHPDRKPLDAQVRGWYSYIYGNGPILHDATGRPLPIVPIRPLPGGGPVQLGAYDRSQDGQSVHVSAHSRSRPS